MPWCLCGFTVIETFIHSQYNPGCTINKVKQNKKCKRKKAFDFTINASLRKKVPRPNVDENQRSSFIYDTACLYTRPTIFSHKLLSKSFEIKPQLMMAAATGLPSVGYKTWCACCQSVCIGCSTIGEVTNPLITKKPTDYRPSVPGPTYLEHCFFLITCTTCFTRLLTSFRRYIQRLISMSIADGLASTNLLLLYILAINLHIYYIYTYIHIHIHIHIHIYIYIYIYIKEISRQ